VHTLFATEYEWDPAKAKANLRDHKVDFADATLALEDRFARTVHDPDASGQERYISSRRASRIERRHYEED